MSFCTACGSEVGNSTFCTKCGTKQSAPPSPAGGAMTAAAPAKSGGGGALKIILLVLGGIFLIAVLVIGAGVFFAKKKYDEVRASIKTGTDSSGQVTSVETPFGRLEASKDAEKILKDLDIPMYPNAKQTEGGSSSMRINNTTISNVQLETEDPMDQVLEFYKGHYPNANVLDNPDSKMLSLGEQDKHGIVITITKNEESGATQINIANTEKR
jgi:hypothetical protein